ncbi:hypothetical protein [Kingella potus]|uniref:hypothetical protein n=1 Tax=Kingella potus TaxID=265175 RepID=UPI001FD1D28D|nr:hypothetical protein [Kingella potus]UOP01014.1 hypothetical protein LVJ84_01055 [Kingella potus]
MPDIVFWQLLVQHHYPASEGHLCIFEMTFLLLHHYGFRLLSPILKEAEQGAHRMQERPQQG